jgi:hypothetical protein
VTGSGFGITTCGNAERFSPARSAPRAFKHSVSAHDEGGQLTDGTASLVAHGRSPYNAPEGHTFTPLQG